MGSFYTQVLVVEPDADRCADLMRRLGRTAVIIPAHNGISVVCDREADEQEISVLDSVAMTLSARLNTCSVALLNHDDDWMVLRYFERDRPLDGLQIGHTPLSWRGSATRLRDLLRPSVSLPALYAVFLRPYLFQVHRHARLARVLDLPPRSVGHGYRYIAERNFSGAFDMTGVIEV